MKALRHALTVELETMKERQRCLRVIDKLMEFYEEKLDEERKHIALMALSRAKDYIDS